jgi:hypothetical protein
MKKFLVSLFIALPMIAYAGTEYLDGRNQSPFDSVIFVKASESNGLNIEHSSMTNVVKTNLAEGNVTLVAHTPSNDLQNTVPLPVAAPLLALAIALFGFGANRRRV